ncbi:MAG TPA: creatininase family protein [Gemmatimonadota bacterium]|nr:creatininase family protein [Gemmatimonadota bacterium]
MIPEAREPRQLAEMTWEEARDLERGRTVAILPIGAIEAHGPHLPLATDGVIAEAMARAGAAALEARGIPTVLLPSLPYTTAGFAAAFPGTISASQTAVTAILSDIARSIGRHGFRALAIANAHLDPEHLASLHAAREKAAGDGGILVVFPDLTRKPWGSRLTDEFRSGACHAGRFEGSIVLASRPELVRDDVRRALREVPRSLVAAIAEGKRTFEEAGGPRAYFGDPAAATAEEGRETIAALGGILADAVVEALEAEG